MDRSQPKSPHLYLLASRVEARGSARAQAKSPQRQGGTGLQKALQLMAEEPEQRWTVSSLARRAGMSRPVFARKFSATFGSSPLRFLTERRMERAADLLRSSDLPLAEVAERVGYASEFAFNRAFKRHFLVPPGTYRRATRQGAPEIRLAA